MKSLIKDFKPLPSYPYGRKLIRRRFFEKKDWIDEETSSLEKRINDLLKDICLDPFARNFLIAYVNIYFSYGNDKIDDSVREIYQIHKSSNNKKKLSELLKEANYYRSLGEFIKICKTLKSDKGEKAGLLKCLRKNNIFFDDIDSIIDEIERNSSCRRFKICDKLLRYEKDN